VRMRAQKRPYTGPGFWRWGGGCVIGVKSGRKKEMLETKKPGKNFGFQAFLILWWTQKLVTQPSEKKKKGEPQILGPTCAMHSSPCRAQPDNVWVSLRKRVHSPDERSGREEAILSCFGRKKRWWRGAKDAATLKFRIRLKAPLTNCGLYGN